MSIGTKISEWYHTQGRDLPWRDTRDPYRIWIAEVILQQTRIAQGVSYFYRFVERFPDVAALAAAEQDEVLKYWEGLGYYSRARNLHKAAKMVMEDFEGSFPNDYRELLKLKGVGPYTARAVGSFAFDNPVGVIDGNVLRVMSRILGDARPINLPATRKAFQEIVDQWVKGLPSRPFNFGLMDLGSTTCTPTQPACLICPVQEDCQAYAKGLTQLLPHKEKKLKRKVRYFHFYLHHTQTGKLTIRQRPTTGYWGGLWEIPNEEVESEIWQQKKDHRGGQYRGKLKHVFTHFDMMIHIYETEGEAPENWGALTFISPEEIPIFAFARAVLKIFEQTKIL